MGTRSDSVASFLLGPIARGSFIHSEVGGAELSRRETQGQAHVRLQIA